MGVSPALTAAEMALATARGHWFDAAAELDEARHRLVHASTSGQPAAERQECRESMYACVLSYWTGLESYAKAHRRLEDLEALEAAAMHREAAAS